MNVKDLPLEPLAEQPEQRVYCVDDVFLRQIIVKVKDKAVLVPQHVHAYDHHTMLSVGTISVYVDGVYRGDETGPSMLFIAKGKQHSFRCKTDTVLCCFHNLHGQDVETLLAEAPNFLEP